MPRKLLIRTSEYPYHITCRSNNKEWFYIPLTDVWWHSLTLLREGVELFRVDIRAFVLMSNHYHILIFTPECNLDKFMQFFNRELTRRINFQAGRINRVLGGRYKWSLIRSHQYYVTALRYIYQNPVRAGLVKHCSHWPFSDLDTQGHGTEFRRWIEKPMSASDSEKTRKKLRRYVVETG
ncbi:MAG: hypothetical protein HN509_11300 [Halobacteriovoraceae bacterium]|nr:hypothetical protein [Halobacteriovoraceae bacterium]